MHPRWILLSNPPAAFRIPEPESRAHDGGTKGKTKMIPGIDIEVSGQKIREYSRTVWRGKNPHLHCHARRDSCQPPRAVCALDEVDAALDESNSERSAGILQRLSKNAIRPHHAQPRHHANFRYSTA